MWRIGLRVGNILFNAISTILPYSGLLSQLLMSMTRPSVEICVTGYFSKATLRFVCFHDNLSEANSK